MTTSWLHTLLGIIHNAKHHKKVCENKETDSPSGIYRMGFQGHAHYQRRVMKKKKNGSYFGGVGLLLFGWDSYFL